MALPKEHELDNYGLDQLLYAQAELERMKADRSLNRQADVSSTDEDRWVQVKAPPSKIAEPKIEPKKKVKPQKKVMFSQEQFQHDTNSGSSESQEYTNYLLNNSKRRVDL